MQINKPGVPFLKHPVHLLALGLGSGLTPGMPGTMGTLLGVGAYLLLPAMPLLHYGALLLALFLAGIWICGVTARALGVDDHPAIVYDEFVGYLVTMTMAPAGWMWVLSGFLWFRLFDIWKPWPIRWLDRNIKGGLGVMLDDLVAGLYALAALQFLNTLL